MTGIVVTGGDSPPFWAVRDYFTKSDLIIAADSGLDTLFSYGLVADFVIGDMDSLKNKSLLNTLDSEKVLNYPQDKDYTDTELALEYLERKGCDKKIIIGGGGGRFDHQIALYSLFSRDKSPYLWITANEKVYLIEKHFSIEVERGTLISLFPVGVQSCHMTSSGLKWELDNLKWSMGDSGISNMAVNESIIINMISGKLVMILPLNKT
jgi:thiamine pyrophosphokinase